MRAVLSVIMLVAVVVMGCSDAPAPDATQTGGVASEETVATAQWSEMALEALSDDQKAQHATAMAAKGELMGSLLSELETALDEGGPETAITVCNQRAKAIAAEVAASHTVSIGRTSHRLRSPDNQPPTWAEALIERRAGEPVFLAGPEGELAAFLPIRLKPECQMCHGTAEHVTDEVAAAIARDYPDDQAVGFAPGDIRGWLWVEVPPAAPEVDAPTT
jgi:hypothetical protein